MRSAGFAVCLVATLAVGGCASSTPLRVATTSKCQPGAASFLVVHAVDKSGKNVPFAPVAVTGATRLATKTSSAGTLRLALKPGSYSVTVGDNAAQWHSARAAVRLRPGCVVTARAQLIRN